MLLSQQMPLPFCGKNWKHPSNTSFHGGVLCAMGAVFPASHHDLSGCKTCKTTEFSPQFGGFGCGVTSFNWKLLIQICKVFLLQLWFAHATRASLRPVKLGGGFKSVLFSPLFGEDFQFD